MVTLKDISDQTGVAVTTVSRILNNDPSIRVSQATREFVIETAGKLNYRKSSPSKRIASQSRSSYTVAIAESMSADEELNDLFFLYLKRNTEQYCRELGLNLVFLNSATDFSRAEYNGTIDGILAIGLYSYEQVQKLASISGKIVFLNVAPDKSRFDSVVPDYVMGINLALEALQAKGHRKIGYLGPKNRSSDYESKKEEWRHEAYMKYMLQHDLLDETYIIDSDMNFGSAYKDMDEYLAEGKKLPTAFLACNEEAAIGMIQALMTKGYSVPKDISIVSFNDTPRSAYTIPPLTSINVPLQALGAEGVNLLIRRLQEEGDYLPIQVVVPLTLTERDSVADITE